MQLSQKEKKVQLMDRVICRLLESFRTKIAINITNDLQRHDGFSISVSTARRRLRNFGLYGEKCGS